MSAVLGHVLYDGPSLIDGERVVALLSNVYRPSANRDTGDTTQVWVLRADRSPVDAAKDGSDESVCGSCVHRLWKTCYVTIFRAPLQVWKNWKAGRYTADPPPKRGRMRTRGMRFGAYGDPAAVPTSIWQKLRAKAPFTLGYTHQWKTCDQDMRRLTMASTETVEDTLLARSMGWRTFRGRMPGEPLLEFEFECPKSDAIPEEDRLTCEECKACWGADDVLTRACPSIILHGGNGLVARYIARWTEAKEAA